MYHRADARVPAPPPGRPPIHWRLRSGWVYGGVALAVLGGILKMRQTKVEEKIERQVATGNPAPGGKRAGAGVPGSAVPAALPAAALPAPQPAFAASAGSESQPGVLVYMSTDKFAGDPWAAAAAVEAAVLGANVAGDFASAVGFAGKQWYAGVDRAEDAGLAAPVLTAVRGTTPSGTNVTAVDAHYGIRPDSGDAAPVVLYVRGPAAAVQKAVKAARGAHGWRSPAVWRVTNLPEAGAPGSHACGGMYMMADDSTETGTTFTPGAALYTRAATAVGEDGQAHTPWWYFPSASQLSGMLDAAAVW